MKIVLMDTPMELVFDFDLLKENKMSISSFKRNLVKCKISIKSPDNAWHLMLGVAIGETVNMKDSLRGICYTLKMGINTIVLRSLEEFPTKFNSVIDLPERNDYQHETVNVLSAA